MKAIAPIGVRGAVGTGHGHGGRDERRKNTGASAESRVQGFSRSGFTARAAAVPLPVRCGVEGVSGLAGLAGHRYHRHMQCVWP